MLLLTTAAGVLQVMTSIAIVHCTPFIGLLALSPFAKCAMHSVQGEQARWDMVAMMGGRSCKKQGFREVASGDVQVAVQDASAAFLTGKFWGALSHI